MESLPIPIRRGWMGQGRGLGMELETYGDSALEIRVRMEMETYGYGDVWTRKALRRTEKYFGKVNKMEMERL